MRGGSLADIYEKIMNYIRPTSFPKRFRDTLEKYGDYEIIGLVIGRDPISKGIQKLLDIVTFGKVTQGLKNMHYDDLFHLYLILHLKHSETGHEKAIHLKLEKNHVISLKEYNDFPKQHLIVNTFGRKILLAEFIANGKLLLGDNFVRYDAIYNNCQIFINSLLKANDLSSPSTEKFIMQDVSQVLSTPAYGLSRVATDLAHIIGHFFGGNKRYRKNTRRRK